VVTPEREAKAMSEYVQCEHDVKAADSRLDPLYRDDFKRMSAMLFGDLFSKVDRDVYWGRLVPKHGPGAVADKLTSNGKWNQRSWPARLQEFFPWSEFLSVNHKEINLSDVRKGLNIVEPGSELPVRVITVPKTLKTPRIIAIEPTAMQYAQQSLFCVILDAVKEDGFLYRTVGFDDQDPNRDLARYGSLSGELATLDLSEASDRVSNQHVLDMLGDWPHLNGAVQACRSRKADVDGHGVIRLAKFASMGSALCFPIEAMVFLTVIFLGIERELSAPLSREIAIRDFLGRVRVFGDDLIVPVDFVLSVINELETFGFRVNVGKSFWTGRFRESCGREYYDGVDVSIVRIREVLPTSRQNGSGVISAVSLRNQLYRAGLWRSVQWLDEYLGKLLTHFPTVAPTSPLLGRDSVLGYQFDTLDPNTQSPLTKGYFVRAEPPLDHLEGAGALIKCLSREAPELLRYHLDKLPGPNFSIASADSEHLERSGRPKHVSIKLGRRSPY